jgi:hypothetical protein
MTKDNHYITGRLFFILKELGFRIEDMAESVPISKVLEWFTDKHGLYVDITPEFYYNGVNWNWQVFLYSDNPVPEENYYTDGSMMYGDNGEYQTKISAELAAIYYMIEKIKK